MKYYGDRPEDSTVRLYFNTFTSDDPAASATITNLADADIKVHKDGSTTEITTDGASVTIDFDSVTGNHIVEIDMSADAAYTTSAEYAARIEGTTIDGGTVNAWIGNWHCEMSGGTLALIKAGNLSANMVQISGDSTAADNLEAMYDGTGYTDDAGPSTQAQVGALSAGSSSGFNYPVSADNTGGAIIDGVTFVGTQTGTYANTESNEATFHQIDDATNAFDLVYRIAGGATNLFTGITVDAYLTGGNDEASIQLYDHIGADWETVATMAGTNGSAITEYAIKPFSKHTGALGTSEAGNIYIRFVTSAQSNPTLYIATCIGTAVGSQSSMGYESGHVWIDEVAGTSTGTAQGIDGTFANQCDDFDNGQTIADNLGSGLIEISNGNNITLSAALEGYTVYGNGGVLQLGGQNIGGSIIREFGTVSGISGTSANPAFFENVLFSVVTVPPGVFQQCGCDGSLTMVSAGDYTFVDCYSIVAGSSAPAFTKTPGQAITAEWRRFSGGITMSNIESTDTLTISGELGTVTLNGADGTVEIRGTYKAIVDNRTGSPTLNVDGAVKGSDVADVLVDTGTTLPALLPAALVGGKMDSNIGAINASTAAAVNLALSTGVIVAASAITGTLSTTAMTTDLAETTDDHYIGRIVIWTSGVLINQASEITDYTGASKLVTYAATTEAPSNSDTFIIV